MERIKELVDYGVIGILVLMSVLSTAVALERWLYLRSVELSQFKKRQELEIALTRGLHLIATVGSNDLYGWVYIVLAAFTSLLP
jgi:biopolymer transport protein ExbB